MLGHEIVPARTRFHVRTRLCAQPPAVSLCGVAVAQSRGDRRHGAPLAGVLVPSGRDRRCDGRGAFSGPQGGCVVAVELGEVVTHHD
jgi:hypothetical protein